MSSVANFVNLKEDQPLSQTLFSSAYQEQVPKKYQFNHGVVTPTDKTKSNPLANQKVRLITKCVGKFVVFPIVIKRTFCSKRVTSIKAWNKKDSV